MEKLFQFIKRILKVIPGGIFGLLSVLFALKGILISLFTFPGYNLLFYDVSYLAVGPKGLIFDLGLIISGVIVIPFDFYMYSIVGNKEISFRLKKVALLLSVISSLTLSLIGFFPVLYDNIIILVIHGILALITFVGITIYCFLYGLFFLKNSRFSLLHPILSFSVSGIFLFYFTNRWSIVEWIGVGSIMIWIIFNAIFTLFKKM
jgi:hypothetical membrane protein